MGNIDHHVPDPSQALTADDISLPEMPKGTGGGALTTTLSQNPAESVDIMLPAQGLGFLHSRTIRWVAAALLFLGLAEWEINRWSNDVVRQMHIAQKENDNRGLQNEINVLKQKVEALAKVIANQKNPPRVAAQVNGARQGLGGAAGNAAFRPRANVRAILEHMQIAGPGEDVQLGDEVVKPKKMCDQLKPIVPDAPAH